MYFIDNRINAFLGPLIKLLEALFGAVMAGIVCRFFLLQMFTSFFESVLWEVLAPRNGCVKLLSGICTLLPMGGGR